MMINKFSRFEQDIADLHEKSLYRRAVSYDPVSPVRVLHGDREYLMMASNNYLGLTHHPDVKRAAALAVEKYGTGSGGSRLTSGSHVLFEKLERELAEFKQTESAVIFNTGYMANVGTVSAIAQKGDFIISDALNHASIIDGCRLSRAQCLVYPHKDMRALEEILKKLNDSSGALKLIVTDSVFSMDGDIAPLDEIYSLAQKHGALVMADDAHATGVLGRGHGSSEHFGLSGKIDIQLGTFSKALASEGGFVAAKKPITEYLINHARSYIFSTALTPADIAAAGEALHIISTDHSYVDKLSANTAAMKMYLAQQGIAVDTQTPIFPIVVGGNEAALKAAEKLYDDGIILSAIRPPTVPKGYSRLRLTVTAAHEEKDLQWAAARIKACLSA